MGKLTCTVMLGFLSLHVTVILMMLATGTPEWLTSSHNATADRGNATYPDRSKGLWKVCSGDNCTKVDESEQPSWFHAVQALDLAGVCFGVLALLVTYAMLLTDRCKRSGTGALLNTASQLVGVVSAVTALIIFGVKARNDVLSDEFPDDYNEVEFGWSFYVFVAGVAEFFCSAVLSIPSARHFSRRQDGYENI